MTDSAFSTGRAAYALGFSSAGKARRFIESIIAGERPAGTASALAKSSGVHPDIAGGVLNPYPADVHRAIVAAMASGGLSYRQAAKAIGLNPVRASASAATCADTWQAVTAADCLNRPGFQAVQVYRDALDKYLAG